LIQQGLECKKVQNLKDENNRIKGEKGKPDIKASKKKDDE